MKIELDKEDLICLVKGSMPDYGVMDYLINQKLGSFSDNNGWQWDVRELSKLSEKGLYGAFLLCKKEPVKPILEHLGNCLKEGSIKRKG